MKESKIWKRVKMLVLALWMVLSPTANVFAASESVMLATATDMPSYIEGAAFTYKSTTSGTPMFCVNIHKNRSQNIQANLVKNSKVIDGGVVYILKNGYPNQSITGDKDKDYYITQTALWWYLDLKSGTTNLDEKFKTTGSDPQNLRPTIKSLAYAGYSHRQDAIGIKDTKLTLGAAGGTSMTLKDSYYISNDIKATTAQNVSSYNVTLENAPKGTRIVASNGVESVYSSAFSVKANDSFKVKVPASAVTATALAIKVKANAKGNVQYMAYEYQPLDTSMQNLAVLEKSQKDVATEMELDISSSKVSIVKVDSNTQKPIAGAKLVLKDASGKEVTRWTSTINAHIIRNLANGDYTIEEIEAPDGYLLNTNVTKFTVSDTKREFKITINNAPKKVVVNIVKIDQSTNLPLAGAVLLVRKSDGTELTRFTSTTEPFVLTDIPNGTYTVEEISAPSGYLKSNERISFTVDDSHLSHQINFVNAREVIVPDTASIPSIVMAIIGVIILGFGLGFVYKNGQRA